MKRLDAQLEESGIAAFAKADSGLCAPLVVHVVDRLATGGMENGLVNLINLMPVERYRHAILCMRDYTEFRERISRPSVGVFALQKKPGQDFPAYWRLIQLLRRLRPAIVHTRSGEMLDGQLYAALAGVPAKVHSEHGHFLFASRARRARHFVLRRAVNPLVDHYTAVSRDLARWLVESGGVRKEKVTLIYNGVDTDRFHPGKRAVGPPGFAAQHAIVIGAVGRMQKVKDQTTLVKAFLDLIRSAPDGRRRFRLVLVGDGPLRGEAERLLREASALDLAWLPGEQSNVAEIMRGFDIFVLPSRSEGTSNTILEAMATGLPVVATDVGGNPELVLDGITGFLTPAADPAAMAATIRRYLDNTALRLTHGGEGRIRACATFSMTEMVNGYLKVYDGVRL